MERNDNDDCIELQPRLVACALGEEAADTELLEHLRRCPGCRADMAGYARVARALPYAAPEVAPPPGLRSRVIGAVEREAAPRLAEPRPAPARPRRSFALPAFGAALVALALLLLWNVGLQRQVQAQRAQAQASREGWAAMVRLLNSEDLRWYALDGSRARGHFWLSPQQPVGCLVAEDLPPLDSDSVFQVWLLRDGRPVSGGTFEARDGGGWALVRAEEPLTDYAAVEVTVEPRGGSAAPSGPLVLTGPLQPLAAST